MRVAIVGAGFSGTMAAVQLARLGRAEIVLIEKSGRFAAGAAYATEEPAHLLNVRARNMSAWPDEPDHFMRWAQREGLGGAEDFVPRHDYRRYLEGLLRQAELGGKVRRKAGAAVALAQDADGTVLTLASGERMGCDAAVLAGGNYPGRLPAGPDWPAELRVDDPWSAEGAAAVRRLAGQGDDLLLIGTGLTMVDVCLSLDGAGYRGRIAAVSRRGLAPRPHEAEGTTPLPYTPPARLAELMRWIREMGAKHGWRPAVDALRPHGSALWRGLSETERRRFLRHGRPWWDVHRHRIAPAVAARIDALREDGRLELLAGRIEAVAGGEVTIARRGGAGAVTRLYAGIVNCTGPEGRIERVDDPLVRQLLRDRVARPDPLGIGLDVDADSRLIAADGRASQTLFALGPLTRGAFWEIVAVPDIRGQAASVARLACAY
jgi:uncharacterized NAD(P)/FAD-binding protein YdhS